MNIQHLVETNQLNNTFLAIYDKNDYLIMTCLPIDVKQILGDGYWTADITKIFSDDRGPVDIAKIETKPIMFSKNSVVHITVDYC